MKAPGRGGDFAAAPIFQETGNEITGEHAAALGARFPIARHQGVTLSARVGSMGSPGRGKLRTRARRRLEETDDRIEAIAEDCGFGGEEQMRAAFVRMLKIPPREYRKRFA